MAAANGTLVAPSDGVCTKMRFYNPGTTARSGVVGVYDEAGNLLSSGAYSVPGVVGWHDVEVSAFDIVEGTKYEPAYGIAASVYAYRSATGAARVRISGTSALPNPWVGGDTGTGYEFGLQIVYEDDPGGTAIDSVGSARAASDLDAAFASLGIAGASFVSGEALGAASPASALSPPGSARASARFSLALLEEIFSLVMAGAARARVVFGIAIPASQISSKSAMARIRLGLARIPVVISLPPIERSAEVVREQRSAIVIARSRRAVVEDRDVE